MNAGRVELDLVAVGVDQVSAMLRGIEAQAKKTADGLKSTAGATGTLGQQAGVAVPPLARVASVAEDFGKKLTGVQGAIIGGVVGAMSSGVIGAVVDLAGELGSLALEFLQTEPRLDSLSASLIATANDAAKLSAQITNIGISASDAAKNVVGFEQRLNQTAASIARLRGQGDLAKEFERAAQTAATGDAIKAIEENMAAAETAANDARRVVLDLRPKLEKARLDVVAAQEAIKQRGSLGLDDERQRQQLGLAVQAHTLLIVEVKRTEEAYSSAAGAVQKMAEELALLDTLQAEQSKRAKAEEVTRTPRGGGAASPSLTPTKPQDDFLFEGSSGEPDEVIEYIVEFTSSAEHMRDVLQQVAEATRLVASEMPELGSALSEVQAITDKLVEGKISLNGALAAGAAAIAANAAKAVGGVRAEAAVRAVYETAMGFATLATPPISAGHFAAAAMLGAVAGGVGGSGGSRGGGGGARGGASNSGGSSSGGAGVIVNNVHNYQMGFGDRQTMIAAQRQGERSARGTGIGAGAGV